MQYSQLMLVGMCARGLEVISIASVNVILEICHGDFYGMPKGHTRGFLRNTADGPSLLFVLIRVWKPSSSSLSRHRQTQSLRL